MELWGLLSDWSCSAAIREGVLLMTLNSHKGFTCLISFPLGTATDWGPVPNLIVSLFMFILVLLFPCECVSVREQVHKLHTQKISH